MQKLKDMDPIKKRNLMIVFSVICIVLLIAFYILKNRGVDYSYMKEDKSKQIVYTSITQTDDDVFKKEIPYLNINKDFAKNINSEINDYTSPLKNEEHATISYNYDINGDVLSLLVKMVNYSDETGPKIYFKGYNINLKTKNIVTDQELLDLFGYDYNDVEISIANKFQKYYQEMLEKKYYVEDECDYDCFLNDYREVENYLDDIVFYVKNGDLYVYKPFSFYSITGDEEFFKEKHFRFLIEKQNN